MNTNFWLRFIRDLDHEDVARVLVENGADINARDVAGHTPLTVANRKSKVFRK